MNDSELFSYIKNKKDYKETGLDFDYSIEIDDSDKLINIYFKESDSSLDWRININFLPTWIKFNKKVYIVHRGYAYAFMSAQISLTTDILRVFENHKDYKINIYGWSYGSAVAGLCLAYLNSYGIKVNEMVTFGSVKMWYFPIKKNTFINMALSTREYTTPNDFVTWQAPFCHRINKVECGPAFSLFKIFRTPYYHCNYDKFIK